MQKEVGTAYMNLGVLIIQMLFKAMGLDVITQSVVPRTEHTRGSEDVAAIEHKSPIITVNEAEK